jgi:hypothetical protein
MMFPPIPHAILALDLPQHPLLGGFAFSFSLLSAGAQAAFRDQWHGSDKICTPETEAEIRAELGAAMDQLRRDLEAGTAAPGIQARYDAMIRLAESLESPYLAANP